MPKKKAPAVETPIAENEYVKELLALLKENQSSAGKELLEAVGHVSEMEKQLAGAVDELKAMRQELQNLQEQNHPLKAVLQKSVRALEANVAALRERLTELKGAVIKGCKNTLAAVKEQGISALDNAARFFHIKPGLAALRNNINEGIQADEKAISRIKAVSAEYHEAGRHLKNIGRALMGKEAVQEAKAPGRLAKTVQAPYRAERACFLAARNSLDKAVASLDRLERAAERQPSILITMQEHKETSPPKKEKTAPAAAHDGKEVSMEEEVSRKTVAISVQAAKLTGRVLFMACQKFLAGVQKHNRDALTPHGRQTVKQLMGHAGQSNSIQLKGDARLFDRVARKFNVDYAFHKVGPKDYLLFFKAGQADAITAAFSEYTKRVMARQKDKPSIRRGLRQAVGRVKTRQKEREKTREAVQER